MITRDKTQIDTPRSYTLAAPVFTASILVQTHTDTQNNRLCRVCYMYFYSELCVLTRRELYYVILSNGKIIRNSEWKKYPSSDVHRRIARLHFT